VAVLPTAGRKTLKMEKGCNIHQRRKKNLPTQYLPYIPPNGTKKIELFM
jgi:hypothetical protein